MVGLLFLTLIFCSCLVFYYAYPKKAQRIFNKFKRFAADKARKIINDIRTEIKRMKKRKNAKYVAPIQISTDWHNTYRKESES